MISNIELSACAASFNIGPEILSDVARLRRKQATPATKFSLPATNFIHKNSTLKIGSENNLLLSKFYAKMHGKSV